MKETSSSSSHKFFETPKNDDKQYTLSHRLRKTMTKDENEVTQKIKRQRTTKSFGVDFIVYLVGGTPRTIVEALWIT